MAGDTTTLYVGLGSVGARVVAAISSQNQEGAETVSFNFDSEPFRSLCAGYRHEVIPDIVNWATTEGARHQVAAWFDVGVNEPPLRELPDIFVNNNRRSEMRAIFLMRARFVLETLSPALHNCQQVVIVGSTFESSGSTWSIELAEMISDQFPEVDMKLLAVHNCPFGHWSRNNSFWFFREISCKTQLRSKLKMFDNEEAAIDALLTSSPHAHYDLATSLEQAFDRTTMTLDQEMSGHRYRAFELCRAQPISAVVDSDQRAALACLWMATAENRASFLSTQSGQRLTIQLRDTSSHHLQLPPAALPHFGKLRQGLSALALSHRSLGGQDHRSAFYALVNEGIRFFSGQEVFDDSIHQLLSDHRDSIESELEKSHNVSSVSRHEIHTSAVRHDFNSLLMDISNELLNSR